jgi:hypothetical protein
MNSNGRSPTTQSILKAAAGIAALAAIAFGASAIASNGKSSGSSLAGAAAAPGGAARQGGALPQGGVPPQGLNGGVPPQGANGGPPPGGPGGGTPVTGATLAKVKAAALAKYPGTLERAFALPGGGYVAHVFQTSGGEVHVLVSKQFQVTRVLTGPSGGGAPPQQAPRTQNGTSS